MTSTKDLDGKLPSATGPDWQKAKIDYRIGVKSINMISRECRIPRTILTARAVKEKWVRRDLLDQYRTAMQAKLSEDHRPKKEDLPCTYSKGTNHLTLTEETTIDGMAAEGAAVIREHRQDIKKLRKIFNKLANALDAYLEGEQLTTTNSNGEVVALEFMSAKESPSQVAENLSRLLVRAQTLERKAYSMDADNKGDPVSVYFSEADRNL